MFQVAKVNKISDHIVEQIRSAILDGTLNPGDKLASEKELIDMFQVSRATLREALHSLEILGFVEIRKGPAGGAYVVEMEMNKAREYLGNFLHFRNMSIEQLTEVRLVLESYCAEMAATRITQDDLNKLQDIIDETPAVLDKGFTPEYRKNEIEFHMIIARVTDNPVLVFILDFVENLLLDTKAIVQPDRGFSDDVLDAHKRIHKYLSEGNAEKAREEMYKHVKDVGDSLTTFAKEKGLFE